MWNNGRIFIELEAGCLLDTMIKILITEQSENFLFFFLVVVDIYSDKQYTLVYFRLGGEIVSFRFVNIWFNW